MEQAANVTDLTNDEVQEEPLVSQTARKVAFVPDFNENHVQLAVVWDPEEDLDGLALSRGRATGVQDQDTWSETSSLAEQVEERVESQFVSDLCLASPSGDDESDGEVVEEPLVPVEVDHSVALESLPMFLNPDEFYADVVNGDLSANEPAGVEVQEQEIVEDAGVDCMAAAPSAYSKPASIVTDEEEVNMKEAPDDEVSIAEEEALLPVQIVRKTLEEHLTNDSEIELIKCNDVVNDTIDSADEEMAAPSEAVQAFSAPVDLSDNSDSDLEVIEDDLVPMKLNHNVALESLPMFLNPDEFYTNVSDNDPHIRGSQRVEVEEDTIIPDASLNCFALVPQSRTKQVTSSERVAVDPDAENDQSDDSVVEEAALIPIQIDRKQLAERLTNDLDIELIKHDNILDNAVETNSIDEDLIVSEEALAVESVSEQISENKNESDSEVVENVLVPILLDHSVALESLPMFLNPDEFYAQLGRSNSNSNEPEKVELQEDEITVDPSVKYSAPAPKKDPKPEKSNADDSNMADILITMPATKQDNKQSNSVADELAAAVTKEPIQLKSNIDKKRFFLGEPLATTAASKQERLQGATNKISTVPDATVTPLSTQFNVKSSEKPATEEPVLVLYKLNGDRSITDLSDRIAVTPGMPLQPQGSGEANLPLVQKQDATIPKHVAEEMMTHQLHKAEPTVGALSGESVVVTQYEASANILNTSLNDSPASGAAVAAPEVLPYKVTQKSKPTSLYDVFFKRNRKPKKDTTLPERGQRSRSMPKSTTAITSAPVSTEAVKPGENKKSVFSFFGFRSRNRSDKHAVPEKPIVTCRSLDSLYVDSKADAKGTAGRKSNIRIFEIMAKKTDSVEERCEAESGENALIRVNSTAECRVEPGSSSQMDLDQTHLVRATVSLLNLDSSAVESKVKDRPLNECLREQSTASDVRVKQHPTSTECQVLQDSVSQIKKVPLEAGPSGRYSLILEQEGNGPLSVGQGSAGSGQPTSGQGQGASGQGPSQLNSVGSGADNLPATAAQDGEKKTQGAPVSKYLIVVAIDFGTAFSGYAFSFVHDPGSIHMMARWEGGDPGVVNQKTPSILLLTPEGEFHSFGFEARNHYHDLSPEDALLWFYFDKFKMSLYRDTECSRQTALVAANGRKFPALDAVRMTLTFFQQHALTELSTQCGARVVNEDIRWIVTVPAIWSAPAKQFMRVAAYEAGLATPASPDQLVVALEPEAASVHIRKLRMHELVPDKPVVKPLSVKKQPEPTSIETVESQFKTVARYMVVDCGGGTVDITVHDISAATGLLLEVYKATGGPFGSCGIDTDFETLMSAIFGADFIRDFRLNRPSGWVNLMLAFESRKRAASPFKVRQPLNVSLPFSFIDYHRKVKGSSVERAIAEFGEPEVSWSSQGCLRLSPEAMKILYQSTLDNIKETVANIFKRVKDIESIFLVGGLSESPVVQQAMREEFGCQARVIVPQEPSLAVLKGAVSFGLDPHVVSERRSKLTFGASVLHRFVRGKHPESQLVQREGAAWCRDVFDRFVVANQVVRSGDTVVRWYTPASASQTHIAINIYSTEHADVDYVTDPRVTKCATLSLDLTPRGGASVPLAPATAGRRKIQTFMTFADTEIKVSAVDGTTGEKVDASIDFLSI